MSITNHNFWQIMMEKISIANEPQFSKQDFLKEICCFFDIAHAFIYEADYSGTFNKREYFQTINTTPLPDALNLKQQLGPEFFSELSSKKIIIIEGPEKRTPFEEKLKNIFSASSLILIPVLNQHYQLAGFVGLSDRRKLVRKEAVDINTSSAVLSLLANHVKLEMFKKGIALTEQALGNVLDNMDIDIYVNDYYTHDVLYVNQSMAAPYGGVSEMLGKKCWQTIFNDKSEPCDFCPQPKLLDENEKPTKTYTWDYERPFDKSWFRVLSSAFQWTDGRTAHLVASVDITENKRNELLIQKMARFDHLTGLPNRRSLQEDSENLMQGSEKNTAGCFVMFCDLDGFKKVNDTLGHDAGDVLLMSIGQGLKQLFSDEFHGYRQGGDEFVVLVENQKSESEIRAIITKLLHVFCSTYLYKGTEMRCGCSIGIAHYPKDATTPKELFHLADMAMYAAKKAGKGTVRFASGDAFLDIDEYYKTR